MSTAGHAVPRRYTYADYLTWDDEVRCELIDGVVYDMSPSPTLRHQKLHARLQWRLSDFLQDKKCQVLSAPFDVRLPPTPGELRNEEIDTVVQPDLLVVCDESKLEERGCIGPPDLVVEILSESTGTKDLRTKRALYERSGVREYWVVNPWENTIAAHRLGVDGAFEIPAYHTVEDVLETPVLPGLRLTLKEVFA